MPGGDSPQFITFVESSQYPETRKRLDKLHSPTTHIKWAHPDGHLAEGQELSPAGVPLVRSPKPDVSYPTSGVELDASLSAAWKGGPFPHIFA